MDESEDGGVIKSGECEVEGVEGPVEMRNDTSLKDKMRQPLMDSACRHWVVA
jgi:hypothetical protein